MFEGRWTIKARPTESRYSKVQSMRRVLPAALTNLPTLLRLATSRAQRDTDRRYREGCAEESDNPFNVAGEVLQTRRGETRATELFQGCASEIRCEIYCDCKINKMLGPDC